MTFYQELQLSSTGSKQLIKNTTDKKEKTRHILIYNFKVYLVVAFCFLVVTAFSMIFGNDNSVPGVVVLLAILVLRQADFGIKTTHGLISIAGIFAILIVGPRLSNMVDPFTAFLIYRPPLCYSHDRTASRKYASATSRISCASCLHPVTNDFWMPQCYYV